MGTIIHVVAGIIVVVAIIGFFKLLNYGKKDVSRETSFLISSY